MQVYRDNADYIFTASENEATRAYNTAVAAMQAQAQSSGRSGSSLRALGSVFGNVLSAFAGTDRGASKLISYLPDSLNPFSWLTG